MLKNYYGTKFSPSYHFISQREYNYYFMDNENQNMAFITSEIHITYTEIISRSIQFIFVFKKNRW